MSIIINKNNQYGFSLIEVLIFVSILSIFFVTAASITVVSLRNMKISEHKLLATHYAGQLIEWLRHQKEADWNDFLTKNGTFCFKEEEIISWPNTGNCGFTDFLDDIFIRKATINFSVNPVNQINIKITVSWNELGRDYQVPLATIFTRWED